MENSPPFLIFFEPFPKGTARIAQWSVATTGASLRTSRRITESVEISADILTPSVTGPVWKATLPVGNTTASRRAPRMRSTTDRVVTDVSGGQSHFWVIDDNVYYSISSSQFDDFYECNGKCISTNEPCGGSTISMTTRAPASNIQNEASKIPDIPDNLWKKNGENVFNRHRGRGLKFVWGVMLYF